MVYSTGRTSHTIKTDEMVEHLAGLVEERAAKLAAEKAAALAAEQQAAE
jgi:(E)-4-hydroxy-3-methylbut-2-enyl-diphosphate synthase